MLEKCKNSFFYFAYYKYIEKKRKQNQKHELRVGSTLSGPLAAASRLAREPPRVRAPSVHALAAPLYRPRGAAFHDLTASGRSSAIVAVNCSRPSLARCSSHVRPACSARSAATSSLGRSYLRGTGEIRVGTRPERLA